MKSLTPEQQLRLPLSYTESIGNEDAIVFYNEEKICAMGFKGKRKNSAFHVRFRTKERMMEYAQEFLKDVSDRIAYRKKMKQEQSQKLKNLVSETKPGDIFYNSWGYNQTNVDFYKVIKTKGSTQLELIAVYSNKDWTGDMTGKATPDPKREYGEKFSCKGDKFSKWDGKPKYFSCYA